MLSIFFFKHYQADGAGSIDTYPCPEWGVQYRDGWMDGWWKGDRVGGIVVSSVCKVVGGLEAGTLHASCVSSADELKLSSYAAGGDGFCLSRG